MYKMNQAIKLEEPKKDDFISKLKDMIEDAFKSYGVKPKEILATKSLRKLFGGAEVSAIFDIPVRYFQSTSYPSDRIIIYLNMVRERQIFITSGVFILGGEKDADDQHKN